MHSHKSHSWSTTPRPFHISPSILALLVAVLLVIAGSYLRFHQLGAQSLWADELFSASVAHDHPFIPSNQQPVFERLSILQVTLGQSFLTAKAADQSPPLFELLAKASIAVWGLNEFSVRFPSALAASLLLAWLGWHFFRAHDQSERIVFGWALLFCAIDGALIQYAQEARVYSAGTLLAGILCGRWYIRWNRGFFEEPLPEWPEVCVFIAACYAHNNLTLLTAILLSVYGMEALRRRDLAALARITAIPLALSPWVWLSWHTYFFTLNRGIAWVDMSWHQALNAAVLSTGQVFDSPWIGLVLIIWVGAWAFKRAMAFAGRLPYPDTNPSHAGSPPWVPPLAMMALLISYDALVAAVVARSGIYHYRHIIFMVPAMAMMAGTLLCGLRSPWMHALAGAIAIALATGPLQATLHTQKADFRGAYQFVVSKIAAPAPIIGITPADRRFYLDVLAPNQPYEFIPLSVFEATSYQRACDQIKTNPAQQVGLVTHKMRAGFIDDLYRLCNDTFERKQNFEGREVVAEVWQRRKTIQPEVDMTKSLKNP